MTTKEKSELLTAGCQMATMLQRLDGAFASAGLRASAKIAYERWDRAYSAYRKRSVGAKTKRA